jgi:hypothetical protein
LRSQEARCYELIEQVEKARRLIDAPRLLSSARMQARVEYRQKAAALDERLLAFDWVELIVNYLYESLTAYDVRREEIRTKASAEAMIEDAVGLLREVELINTKPLITMIEGARPGLLTFLSVLEKKLQQIEVRWRYVTGSRAAAFNVIARAWHDRSGANRSKRGQRAYLRALCGLGHWSRRIENFTEVQRQVDEVLDQVVRASSAVECFNSLLRPYVAVKKHLSQGFLALIALYHNARPLPQRGNQSPLQLACVDLGDDDWVRLLEHEMRYGQSVTPGA